MMRKTVCVYAEHDAEPYNGRIQRLEGIEPSTGAFCGMAKANHLKFSGSLVFAAGNPAIHVRRFISSTIFR